MKEGADISGIAAMIGDPARANVLTALLSDKVLTAGELAVEAGAIPVTASGHFVKPEEAGLLWRYQADAASRLCAGRVGGGRGFFTKKGASEFESAFPI